MTEAKQFGAIVEDVYVYRETQGSASHQKSLESILDMLQGMWDNLKLAEKIITAGYMHLHSKE